MDTVISRIVCGRVARLFTAGLLCASAVVFASRPAHADGDAAPPATQPATDADHPASLPHIHVDVANKVIDIEARVATREAKWLELLACTPGTRDYEAILTTPAQPSHIHLALVMIGLEPGAPMRWWRDGDEVKSSPAHGPSVIVTIVTRSGAVERETPANEWIVNQKTGEVLPAGHWLFTGSEFAEIEGRRAYRADLNGTVISLVNFSDDLLTHESAMTNMSDDSTWGCRTAVIPPVGTIVLIRLRPGPAPASTQPATQPAGK
ncbi:MAG: YdjY domain-containing protein [Planctomycetes bacterium]|nr:YdjY domain-containing protein [Planctomycetota bacterium]